jgi:hypothetical protein
MCRAIPRSILDGFSRNSRRIKVKDVLHERAAAQDARRRESRAQETMPVRPRGFEIAREVLLPSTYHKDGHRRH